MAERASLLESCRRLRRTWPAPGSHGTLMVPESRHLWRRSCACNACSLAHACASPFGSSRRLSAPGECAARSVP
eukprot:14455855-Alexandrium_andersonii.AAC.1